MENAQSAAFVGVLHAFYYILDPFGQATLPNTFVFVMISKGFLDFQENWWGPGTFPVCSLLPLGTLWPYFLCLGSTMESSEGRAGPKRR